MFFDRFHHFIRCRCVSTCLFENDYVTKQERNVADCKPFKKMKIENSRSSMNSTLFANVCHIPTDAGLISGHIGEQATRDTYCYGTGTMASSPTKNDAKFSIVDHPAHGSVPQPEGLADEDASVTPHPTPKQLTTCCKCPGCTCGPECSCPQGERAGCDPCAVFTESTAAAATAARLLPSSTNVNEAPAMSGALDPPSQLPPTTHGEEVVVALDHPAPNPAAPGSPPESISPPTSENPSDEPDVQHGSADTAVASNASSTAGIAAGGIVLTRPEQQALRKERRNRARNAKLAQITGADKAKHGGGKRRWARGKNRRAGESCSAGRGGPNREVKLDAFDEWLGVRLKGWFDGEVVEEGGGMPPLESGVLEQIDFDAFKDEIAFPASLSARQRRQVHGWAMQFALFHASSGEDTQRHVIISKTGVFHGKLLTRGGSTWYKEGVAAPVVERFALQPGYEEVAKPLVSALHSFHESVQLREAGFALWLKAIAPGPLDGSDLAEAQETMTKWPSLENSEWEFVNTPQQILSLVEVLESCQLFGFDLEAHNARTFHGLTCLLQISTEEKDYVVDPLAEGVWDCMGLLRGPFGNSDILKIGHAIRSCDVPSLYRDFGIVVVNAVDTAEAVHALGEKHSGLAKVLEKSGVKELHDMADLKQTMQACDWRERPLSPDKLVYARCDSHYLIPLWHLLRSRLLGADTFANREDAREELELREMERQLHADLSVKGDQGITVEDVLLQQQPSPRATLPLDNEASDRHGVAGISGAEFPVPVAEEHWTSEWDDPENCHRDARSRSGSFFISDLESIHESDSVVTTGAGSGRVSMGDGESDFTAPLPEGEEEEEEAGVVPNNGPGGSDGALLPLDLGDTFAGDIAPDEQDSDMEADEDEDLWEGWGDTTGGEAGVEAGGDTVVVEDGGTLVASVEATLIPRSVAPVSNETGGTLSSPSPSGEAGISKDGVKTGGATRGQQGTEPAIWNEQHIVHTDGVRLLLKALSRAHLAANVLWRPAAEARREDSHNERHFRTAVQRLKPPRWSEVNVSVYEEIYLWRDRTARRMDDGVAYVCPGDILIDIALALPTTLDALRKVSVPLSPVLGQADTPEAVELVAVVRRAPGVLKEGTEEDAGGKI